jgi:hypothetical protein
MSWLKNLFGSGSKGGCRSCNKEPVTFRCTRCSREYCESCIVVFGEKATRILMEKVYGSGTTFGSAKIFDDRGRAFCPDCYGKLLDRSVKTGQWVVQSQEEMDPSCVRLNN